MKQYKTSAQLKDMAKDKLMGKYGIVILTVFLSMLINLGVTLLFFFFTPMGGLGAIIFSLLLNLGASIVLGVLNAGISFFFLNIACNQNYSETDLFYGFREQTTKFLTISAAFAAVQFFALLPYQFISSVYMTRPDSSLWMLLTICSWVLGMLLYVPLSLAISQAFYLALDFPGLSAGETLKKSMRIMKGHKRRLFYIEISFLPLMVVSLFSCCIGYLWLIPYMDMTMTYFYLDLMNPGTAGSQ